MWERTDFGLHRFTLTAFQLLLNLQSSFVCTNTFAACMSVKHMSEEGVGSPETGVKNGWKAAMR